jgi:tetratricopeptide (TPR) repeat protein
MVTASPVSEEPPADDERIEGIHVLRLRGNDYEMGYQHGRLLRDAIARGPIPYFARWVEKLVSRGFFGPLAPLAKGLGKLLTHTVGRRIAQKFPKHVQDAIKGLADGAGIDQNELLRAVTMPETYLWLGIWYKRVFKAPIAPRYGVPVIGCTSALAWSDATTHRRLLHGRNFDYQGVGAWDKEQAVIFHEPSDGQPYVSIAAAGVLLGGVTAMNASGISLVVHQHIASIDFDLDGLPVGVVGDLVMRHARTLDDAKRILDDHRPNGAWTYIVASAKERRAMAYEVSAHHRAVIDPKGDTFGYANIFLDRTLEKTEVDFYPSYWRNNVERYHAANRRLEQSRGKIDADMIASILGDIGDGCRLSKNVSALTTVASVVFDAERSIVHVATGRAPVCNRPYIAFDLDRKCARTDLPKLLGGTRVDPSALEAFDCYREAYERHFGEADLEAARRLVERARERAPNQAVYAFVAGLLAIEARDWESAVSAFTSAIAIGHDIPQRMAAFHLWRGRAHDALGHRELALRDYRQALVGSDPAVHRAARKNLDRVWKPKVPAIEWSYGDVLAP